MTRYPQRGRSTAFIVLGVVLFLLALTFFFFYMFWDGHRVKTEPKINQSTQLYTVTMRSSRSG